MHRCICIMYLYSFIVSQCHQTFSCTIKSLLCFPSRFQPYERVTFFEIWKEPWVCDRVMAWKRRKPTKSLFSLNFVHVWRWPSSLFNSPPRRAFLRVTVHEHFQFLQYTPTLLFRVWSWNLFNSWFSPADTQNTTLSRVKRLPAFKFHLKSNWSRKLDLNLKNSDCISPLKLNFLNN